MPELLILGHGLAGACLAMEAHWAKIEVQIVSDPNQESASRKAVGLMNPVTGRRMARTWNYEEIFPYADTFYEKATLEFIGRNGPSFLLPKPIYKALHTIEELNYFSGKSADQGFEGLLEVAPDSKELPLIFDNMKAWCLIREGGRMETLPFLEASEDFWTKRNAFQKKTFLPNDLKKTQRGWDWEGRTFKWVVSCLGLNCPWVGQSLFPVKGQVFEITGWKSWGDAILKTRPFFVPSGDGNFLAGSTYERNFTHNEPDDAGWEEISQDLSPAFREKAVVIRSWAGLRPTSVDRKPVMGKKEEGIYCLNGLGSKGVTLAPWTANQLIRMIIHEAGS